MLKFLRKHHRWFGLILTVFIILFSISGIIMNHRKTFSGYSVSRQYLPPNYSYKDWNFAAVRSTEKFSADSILIYGNIGIWLTDSLFSDFKEFNTGFDKGVDNHKITKVVRVNENTLAAGSLFGLHMYQTEKEKWEQVALPNKAQNVVDIIMREDTLLVMTRSFLFSSTDYQNFTTIELPAPAGYDNKVGLFKTMWVLHSGELYGLAGRLFTDLIAIIMIFLSIGGFIMYFQKKKLKDRGAEQQKRQKLRRQYQWQLKWHNRFGYITILLLILTTVTGIFLRPPFLIPIAESKVKKIPNSELATPNPWYDLLRRMIYIEEEGRYIISTQDAFYYSDDNLRTLICFDNQPPASVMGVTILEKYGKNTLMIGSFEGLFSWNYAIDSIYDLVDKKEWIRPEKKGHPVGAHKISGYSAHFGSHPLIFDYDEGTKSSFNQAEFPAMTDEIIQKNPMPLWNLSQEIHTGRIFQYFLGDFYILIVPLTGIFAVYLYITGFVVWYKQFRRQKKRRSS